MNHIKTEPKGYDINIQKHQVDLYNNLKNDWGLRDEQIAAFGRVYRNQTETGYVPEFYMGGKDYKEVLLDDKIPVQFFYGISNSERITNEKSFNIDVHMVMMAKLDVIKKNIKHRPDTEVHVDVEKYLRLEQYGFMMKSGVITGVDRVFDEYPGMNRESIKYKADMHPWHCFRFDLICTYNPSVTK